MKKQKIIGSLLAGIIVFGCLSACTSSNSSSLCESREDSSTADFTVDSQYSAVLSMSRLKDYASAWEMKYNPENYKVGADWKEAIKNNNVEKIVNLNEKLKLGEGLKGCISAYWVIYTDTIDLSDFTSEKKYLKKIGDSLVLNLGGTKSIERDELSDMLENGKKITFICLYTAVDTDEGVQNCVYPIIYDAGDGAYLYKPYFKTMGTSIIDKNKMAQSTTESDTPVSVRVM